MLAIPATFDPAAFQPHPLHASDRQWPETNCWTDLWIEIVAALGLEPRAMLGFTLTQDYEGDQATFFKVPAEDLDRLYGLRLTELSIFDKFERHVLEQVGRGRIVVAEVDGYFLPDTAGTAYRTQHTKTTVGITRIDPANRRVTYFHNAIFASLDGDDYDGLFAARDGNDDLARKFPYTEFLKLPARAPVVDLKRDALALLRHHFDRRPAANPFTAWARDFDRHAADLAGRSHDYFHTYAFALPRQFGANFELLASHLQWLTDQGETGFDTAGAAAYEIAATAKILQFKLARAMARGKFDGIVPLIETMATHYDQVMAPLSARFAAPASDRVAA